MPINKITNQEAIKTLEKVKKYQMQSMTCMPSELTDFQEVQTQSLILSDLMGKLVDLYSDIISKKDYINIDIDMVKEIHKEFLKNSNSIMNLRFGDLDKKSIMEMADSNLNLGPIIKIMISPKRKISRLLEWVEFMNTMALAYGIYISHFVNKNNRKILYKYGYIIATPSLYTRLILRNETDVSFDFSGVQTAVNKIVSTLLQNGSETYSNMLIHGDYLVSTYYEPYECASHSRLKQIDDIDHVKPYGEYGTSGNAGILLRNFIDLYSENISWYIMHSILTVMSCSGYKFVPHDSNSEVFTVVFCPDDPTENEDSKETES